MEARLDALEAIVDEIQPCSVRQALYQAVVRGVVGKTEQEYEKVQRALVRLRRQGRVLYGWITDGTRWRIKPRTYSSVEQALLRTSQTYRRGLWDQADVYVEVWLEKDALSGVVHPVTDEYDVGLHVARGFSSLSFLAQSAEEIADVGKPAFICHLGDHDPSGRNAGEKIEATLRELAPDAEIHFERLAVTMSQIADLDHPLRQTKHTDSRAKRFEAEFGARSVELDAIHPDELRRIVRDIDAAQELGKLKLPIFMFQEHDDRETRAVYEEIARVSGGAYAKFDSSSAERLSELLRTAALFAAGGATALAANKSAGARLLLGQIKP